MSRTKKVSFNSPAVLGFVLICLCVLLMGKVTNGMTDKMFFSVYRSSLFSPLTYVRLVGHVFGHANWSHFSGNIMLILLVGPLLEEKYGTSNIIFVMLTTAVVTGLVNMLLFPHTVLLGASGIVFAFIILSSFASIRDGKIPFTFILISVIYIGGQIYDGLFKADNISNLTHIIGGIIGGSLGYFMNKNEMLNRR